MDYLSIRTRGNSTPERKPRVYFTCHPDDFARYFDTVCEDIFKTQDCAIYYTADMTASLPEEYRETDLGSMNLFVVPVTFRLLTEPNRAMDSDIAFALEKHVPILPLMMETGIDEFYAEKFGKLQYLSPYSHDLTEISYEEKLKKYLTSILLDDETAEKVRAAFDAYIFLSYRKKDRQYANELMKLIHADPKYQDIAIWYDEFLTPGESFSDSIEKMLKRSNLFTLLVTPNLVNEENYVKSVEYPAAKQANKKVLPAEMVETDAKELKKQYDGIPDVVKAKDDAALRESLAQAFSEYARRENDDDPMHNYLIGLAYLEGIDVEVNREKAVELITKAAEAELPEAMEKLRNMYHDGYYVALDWQKSFYWTKKLSDYCVRQYGEKHTDTLTALNNLAVTYGDLGDYKKALELEEKVYALRSEVLGAKHPDTLISLNNLAVICGAMGDREKARKFDEILYTLRCETLGEKHPDTLISLNNLAAVCGYLGDNQEALELSEKVYALRCEVLGEKHPDTLASLNNLATTYGKLGDHKKALKLEEKVYALQCEVLGEKHPDTLAALNNLAYTYGELGDHKKALKLKEKVYTLLCEVLGEKHPDTLTSLSNLAVSYGKLGDFKKALELEEKVNALRCEVLGEKHPDTLASLNNLATTYYELGDRKKALELEEKVYALLCEVLGEKHPDTLTALYNLAGTYYGLGDYKKALELNEKVYALRCEVLGEKHPDTLTTLNNLAVTYGDLGDYKKALELYEKVYALRCEVLGEKHPDTLHSLRNLAMYCQALGYHQKSAFLKAKYKRLTGKRL